MDVGYGGRDGIGVLEHRDADFGDLALISFVRLDVDGHNGMLAKINERHAPFEGLEMLFFLECKGSGIEVVIEVSFVFCQPTESSSPKNG